MLGNSNIKFSYWEFKLQKFDRLYDSGNKRYIYKRRRIFFLQDLFVRAILCAPADGKSNPPSCSTCNLLYMAMLSHCDGAL